MKKRQKNSAKVNNPQIFIISGPSGAGEDSVISGLQKKMRFNRVITTITRPRRKGEKQGKPYYFTTVKKFKQMIKNDELIEWAIVYGDYRGCTKKEILRLQKKRLPILWKIDWQGVKTVKKIMPKTISIFIAPPSYKAVEQRLIARGKDSKATIKKRAEFTKEWLKHKDIYDYMVINKEGQLDQTIEKILKIIKKHLACTL